MSDKEGFFSEPTSDCSDRNLVCYHDRKFLSFNSREQKVFNTPDDSQSFISMGVRSLIKVKSSSARMWWAGHELSHTSDVAPQALVSCLAQNQDLHRFSKSELDKTVKDNLPPGGGTLDGRGTEYARFFKEFDLLNKKIQFCKDNRDLCTSEQTLAYEIQARELEERFNLFQRLINLDSKVFKIPANNGEGSFSQSIQRSPPEVMLERLLMRRIETIESKEEVSGLKVKPLNNESAEVKRAKKFAQTNKNLENLSSDEKYADDYPFIEQYSEAVADFRGSASFLGHIREKYKDNPVAQREAVMALLFSLKPSHFTGEYAKLMNSVGSKKLNESRVLRGILANRQIQNILGCRLEADKIPETQTMDCSDPQVLSRFTGQTPKPSSFYSGAKTR